MKKNFALLELLERLEDAAKEKENIFTTTFLGGFQLLDLIIRELKSHMTC